MNKIKLIKFLLRNWTKILSLSFFVLLLGAYAYTFAVPPATKYSAGETLDPICGPLDPNCTVDIGSGGVTVDVLNNSVYTETLGSPSVRGSVLLGYNAGINLDLEGTEFYGSNFIGYNAGSGAVNAGDSNFIGTDAGSSAVGASMSNFIGYKAGDHAYYASNSNFFGESSGYLAADAENSNFFGRNAGSSATGATGSNFLGADAGSLATNAYYSNFLGTSAGSGATGANQSNFLGYYAGYGATGADGSNFLGSVTGYNATGARYSNFIGSSAGLDATNAYYSNFIGVESGSAASAANDSTFIGRNSGYHSTNAAYSVFIGSIAGNNSPNASNSIFIGQNAGFLDTVNNTTNANDFSILIGKDTKTGGFKNSIAIGGSATNTATNQLMIGSTTRPINQTIWNTAGGTTCTLISTGLTCTSDENFKTNIEDLKTDTLDKLLNVKTITFNWKEGDTDTTNVGFLAQDLEDYFPELVSEDVYGNKSVNYANMTPILVEAIRELDLKVKDFAEGDFVNYNSMKTLVKNFLEDFTNGLEIVFFGEVHTKKLCIDDVCIDKAQLEELLTDSDIASGDSSTEEDSGSTSGTDDDTVVKEDEGNVESEVEEDPSTTGDTEEDVEEEVETEDDSGANDGIPQEDVEEAINPVSN